MDARQVFESFTPSLIAKSKIGNMALEHSIQSQHMLLCGEMHGVIENADVLYSLFHHFSFSTFALERTKEEAGAFIDSLKPNVKVDFSLIDKSVFIASVMSPQLAKTIHTMFAEGRLKDVVFVDSDEEDREQEMAKNIISLDKNQKILGVLGNWHTATGVDGHKSALEYVRNEIPNVPCLDYKYCSGQYYNIANGLGNFDDVRNMHPEYKTEQCSDRDFELYIPEATPITT